MDNPIDQYWNLRLEALKQRLAENNFEVHVAMNQTEAAMVVMTPLLRQAEPGPSPMVVP